MAKVVKKFVEHTVKHQLSYSLFTIYDSGREFLKADSGQK